MHRLFPAILATVIGGLILLSGCAHRMDYNRLYAQLQNGECRSATRHIESSRDSYGSNAQLLYLLDSAMVHLQCREFAAAQKKFHSAERLAESLWTESISRQAASLVTNEYLLKYPGEDYERALINMMSAIGYLQTEAFDDALVEIRRLDSLLSLFNEKYDQKNVYKEDAFGRYLSGILHEADNALDDAFIDYRKALITYRDYQKYYGTPAPASLVEDLRRVAAAVDRLADIESLLPLDEVQQRPAPQATRRMGKLVFLQLSGPAPAKTQGQVVVPTARGPVSIAYPRLLLLPPACMEHRLTLASEDVIIAATLDLVQDIGRIALKNLEDKKGRIMAKTIARAVAKQVVIDSLANSSDQNTAVAMQTALNIANLFLEQADTRSWRTLPGQIYMARLFIPPGEYTVQSAACDGQSHKLQNILVKAGKTNYIVHDDRFIAAAPIE